MRKNKSIINIIKEFEKLQKMADKCNCTISIELEGKETVIAGPKETKR